MEENLNIRSTGRPDKFFKVECGLKFVISKPSIYNRLQLA
jgi:hypothetical protein